MPELTLDLHWQAPRTRTEQIIASYRAGTSLAVIATSYDTSVATVKRVLAEAGVPLRKREPKAWAKCWT